MQALPSGFARFIIAFTFTRFIDHTQVRATVGRSPLGRVISSSQRLLPDNSQHTQQTNTHAPGWIQTHDRSRQAAVELRLRLRGRWDRQLKVEFMFKIGRTKHKK
jgi:hypothetical protein